MVVIVASFTTKRRRMHRNTMRPSPQIAVMAAKPPKPPCWRDFVAATKITSHAVSDTEFTDISKVARSSNESFSSDGQANAKGKPKRIRAKIHRTRSQFTIEESDLPEETLTVTLAETKPGELGLCRQVAVDERLLEEDNNRKCQTWLQGVAACQPLEAVVSDRELSDGEAEGVPLEIPDDTLYYDQPELRPPPNSSASGSESGGLHTIGLQPRALHRSRTYAPKHDPVSSLKGHLRHEGKHSVVEKGDTHINTG